MKYVVTGGAGFIGSHLTDALINLGHEVVVLDNLSYGKQENVNRAATFVYGNVIDPTQLLDVFEGADGVFHQASIVSVPVSIESPSLVNEINLGGTLDVLNAARECGVKKVVFASSAAVYGNNPPPNREDMKPDPLSPYAISKIAGEYYMNIFSKLYGIETVSLRYFNVYGPRQRSGVIQGFIQKIVNHRPLVINGDGFQTRDFVYVDDVVQANILAMESSVGGTYNVATGIPITILGLAGAIMDIAGTVVPVDSHPCLDGEVYDSYADISLTRGTLKYEPKYTLRKGLEEML